MTGFDVALPDGAVLKARDEGEGAPLLLVSGLGGTAGFWDAAAQALATEARVIRFDQRGIAGSTRGTEPVDIALLARDALAVLDAAWVEKAVVLGHSTGGCIAQTMARIAPERVEAVVLSAAWAGPSRYMQALFRSRRAVLFADPQAYAEGSVLLSYPPAWLEANWTAYQTAAAKAPRDPAKADVAAERIDALLSFDGRADLSGLDLPALVLGAADDMIVPPFLQAELAAALPRARRHEFGHGGHFYPVSRTEDFAAAVAAFLRGL